MVGKVTDFLSAVTGRSGRHNQALRQVSDWALSVAKFLADYGLEDDDGLKLLLAKDGDAKFDLTGLAHNGRPLLKTAGAIKEQDITTPVAEILEAVQDIRRYMINPELQQSRLTQAVNRLRETYGNLRKTLNNTELL